MSIEATAIAMPGCALALESARGEVLAHEPMGRHCTWRAGGHAECLFKPADADDLKDGLRALPAGHAVAFIGLGSNLLVRDGGFAGTLIATNRALGFVEPLGAGRYRAGAGVPCAKLARSAAREGFGDAAFLAGIPGTLGGALAQNAGAFGAETWDFVETVETVTRAGEVETRPAGAFVVGYREVEIPRDEWFMAATFRFGTGPDGDADKRIRELLAKRAASQPTGQASCGSVFRNPEGDYAGRLIEAAGLKGLRRGGCVVSTEHANFIINDRDATAGDIEGLMQHLQAAVKDRFGVELVPEVKIIGNPRDTASS